MRVVNGGVGMTVKGGGGDGGMTEICGGEEENRIHDTTAALECCATDKKGPLYKVNGNKGRFIIG